MKGYVFTALLAVAISLSACVTTTPAGWQPVDSPALEQLGGEWVGKWKTEALHGGIVVTIKPASNYAVTTIDGDPYATKNTWQSAVNVVGDEVIIDAHGFARKETYKLYTDVEGTLVLDGSYTIKGRPWGTVTLHRRPKQASSGDEDTPFLAVAGGL